MPIALGLIALTATTAFCSDDSSSRDAAELAGQLNAALATMGLTPSNCSGQSALPDAPVPQSAPDQGGLGSLIHLSTSMGMNVDKQDPGGAIPKGGTVGLTFGRIKLSQALARLGVSLDPGTKVMNLNYMFSPLVSVTADAAGSSAIQQIQQQESGQWAQSDIDSIKKRIASLKRTAWTERVTASAALVTKDGRLFSCEAGKGPQVAVPSNDPNGTTNPAELSAGGSITASRVGSAYSTTIVQCIEAQPRGKESKLQFSLLVYRGTIPYINESDYFGNVISMTPQALKKNDGLMPDSVRAGVLYNKNFNDKDSVSISATAGETEGKITHSANGSAVIAKQSRFRDTVFAGANESYTPSINMGRPGIPNAQKQTGYFLGDSVHLISSFSVYGVKQWNKGNPDCSTATDPMTCLTAFERDRYGVQWSKPEKGPNHLDRMIFGLAYQKTSSPDQSVQQIYQGGGLLYYGKYTWEGTPFRHHRKDQR